MLITTPIAAAERKAGIRNRLGGSIGSRRRRSISTKAMPEHTATAKPATTGALPSPWTPPSISEPASAASARIAVSWPGRSIDREPERGVSPAYRSASAMPSAPIGTLMKKIARQPSAAIRRPPTSGPPDRAMLAPAAHRPIARPRRSGSGWAWRSSVREHGTRIAAPTPCTARAAISAPIPGAPPHAIDAIVNSANPATYTRRAPIRSPSEPQVRISAANVIV